jgi:uncharacterized protein
MRSAISLILAVATIAVSTLAHAQSWCSASRLNSTERAICSNSELKALDRRLVSLYGQAKARGKDAGQVHWLRTRNSCGTDETCIQRSYRSRIATLESRIVSADYASPGWCSANNLNSTERAICSSSELGALDKQIMHLYGQAKAHGYDRGQLNWLRRRNSCGGDKACIAESYRSRISVLESRHLAGDGTGRRSSAGGGSSNSTSAEDNDVDGVSGAETAVLGIALGVAAAKGIFNWIGGEAGRASSWASSSDSAGRYRFTVECTGTTFSGLPTMTYSGTVNAGSFDEASALVRNEQSQRSCYDRFGAGYVGEGYAQFDHQ